MANNRVIAVMDGDLTAARAVQEAAEKLGVAVVNESIGNPTSISGAELIAKIKEFSSQTVVVMFDDQGETGLGLGEEAFLTILSDDDIEVIGVLAVASNLKSVQGIEADFSITQDQTIINEPVDKKGKAEEPGHKIVEGDTVDVLNAVADTLIIGIGDLGKMDDKDLVDQGAPVTTKAIAEILQRSGQDGNQ